MHAIRPSFLLLCLLGLVLSTAASADKVPQKIYKKLARHHLMASCWGQQSVREYYKAVKKAIKLCNGLTPTFDLDIFEGDYKGRPGLFGPGAPSQPSQPIQPAQPVQPSAPTGFNRFGGSMTQPTGNLNNPYDAWLAFLEFQKSQQHQQQPEQRSPAYARRYRRATPPAAAAAPQPSPAELAKFSSEVEAFKLMKKESLFNLTCVLADLGALDANLDINLKWYTDDSWNLLVERPDPEFKRKMIEGTEDCFSFAQAVPQAILDKNPLFKKFGRNMIFYKCQDELEMGLCAKQDILRLLEETYGPLTSDLLGSLGLPTDRYDAALMAKKVMFSAASDSEKFVKKVIFGGLEDEE